MLRSASPPVRRFRGRALEIVISVGHACANPKIAMMSLRFPIAARTSSRLVNTSRYRKISWTIGII